MKTRAFMVAAAVAASAPATALAQPLPPSDVLVTLQGPPGTNPDATLAYAIELRNAGPGAATGLTLRLTLAVGTTYVSFAQESGPMLTCSGAGSPIDCTAAASLPAGAVATFRLVVQVGALVPDGTQLQAFASVSADDDPDVANDESSSLACVQLDSCAAGPCNGDVAVVCSARNECHDPGSCNPVTGQCASDVPKGDGAACSDGNGCTQSDRCAGGACVGGAPKVCPVAGICEVQGTCNPRTGGCAANAPKLDGDACDDGDACTLDDACRAGSCTGSALDCDDAGAPAQDAAVPVDAGRVTKDGGAIERDAGTRGGGRRDAGHAVDDGNDGNDADACSCKVGPGAGPQHPRGWLGSALLALMLALTARLTRNQPRGQGVELRSEQRDCARPADGWGPSGSADGAGRARALPVALDPPAEAEAGAEPQLRGCAELAAGIDVQPVRARERAEAEAQHRGERGGERGA